MERGHIERSLTVPSTCFPAGIVIIQISTRPEPGGLRESGFGLVNRKIRHKAPGEILFSHKEERPRVEWLDYAIAWRERTGYKRMFVWMDMDSNVPCARKDRPRPPSFVRPFLRPFLPVLTVHHLLDVVHSFPRFQQHPSRVGRLPRVWHRSGDWMGRINHNLVQLRQGRDEVLDLWLSWRERTTENVRMGG